MSTSKKTITGKSVLFFVGLAVVLAVVLGLVFGWEYSFIGLGAGLGPVIGGYIGNRKAHKVDAYRDELIARRKRKSRPNP
ncbi:hypothetical protein E2F48_14065 [Arthrobacter crusticola]|uniref:Uncharacterized protein n=1 Tax=Arthrobacter crusticola TaxID=2547960 RepID=A0A4R5TTH6_9MICC|nr:hypothetical protein [Arthrobacter crusticola]TDK23920.1 hypothetical protein E2F48_14065 [Arthrobacter crusticola]